MNIDDAELIAMQSISQAMAGLDEDGRQRVIQWAASRFLKEPLRRVSIHQTVEQDDSRFSDLGDLFHATSPSTDADRALVAAFWFQQVEGRPSLRAQEMNTALHQIGQRLPNITDGLRTLERRTPALVRQTTKAGRTRQARKTYKLTADGIARVEGMIAREGGVEGAEG